MERKITYHQQVSFCGKERCRRCQEGVGHGPYWYAYEMEQGRTIRRYIGKQLPAHVQLAQVEQKSEVVTSPDRVLESEGTSSSMDDSSLSSDGRLSRLVGRENELATIRQMLHETAQKKPAGRSVPMDTQKRPQCLVLMGDPGIGKTRLAEEAVREVQKKGWITAWSQAYAKESQMAYRLWKEILQDMLRSSVWQKQEIKEYPDLYVRLAAFLPELYADLPSSLTETSQPAHQEPHQLWDAVREFFTLQCKKKPVLVVLDDIQWADTYSCELLGYLIRRLNNLPVMFIVTCREVDLPPEHLLNGLIAHMLRERVVQKLALHPLTNKDVGSMIGRRLPRKMVQRIQERAAGNPLFVEELVYSARLQDGETAEEKVLPDTITAVMEQRIRKVSSECLRLLNMAAVLGGSFAFDIISAMERGAAKGKDEDQLLDLLDEAMRAGILREEGRGTETIYRFWHPLLVSYLYGSLVGDRLRRLHQRAAIALQKKYEKRPIEVAAAITHHLQQGNGDTAQIARYAALAGDRAYELSAYPDAEKYYRIAIEHLGSHEGMEQSERLHLAYLLEQLAECARIQGNFDGARSIYERVLEVRSYQRSFASAEEAREEAQLQALLWSELGSLWFYNGNHVEAHKCSEQAIHALLDAGVRTGAAWARIYYMLSYLDLQEGKYEEGLEQANKALQIFEEVLKGRVEGMRTRPLTRTRRTLEGDRVDLARAYRGLATQLNSMGRFDEALVYLQEALTRLKPYDEKRELAHIYCNMGHVQLEKVEHEQALSSLKQGQALAELTGDMPLLAVISCNFGLLAARKGDLQDAEDWMRQAIELVEQFVDKVYISEWNAELGSILQDRGELTEAKRCIARSLSVGRAMQNIPCIGMGLVVLGNLRIIQALEEHGAQLVEGKEVITNEEARSVLNKARRTLQRALALKKIEATTRTRGTLSLAQVFLLQGDARTAHELATQALEEAQKRDYVWLVARSQRMLGSIEAVMERYEMAEQYFEQALTLLRERGMRLDYGRTLVRYGGMLLVRQGSGDITRGKSMLEEARKIFRECGAKIDVKRVERMLNAAHL